MRPTQLSNAEVLYWFSRFMSCEFDINLHSLQQLFPEVESFTLVSVTFLLLPAQWIYYICLVNACGIHVHHSK